MSAYKEADVSWWLAKTCSAVHSIPLVDAPVPCLLLPPNLLVAPLQMSSCYAGSAWRVQRTYPRCAAASMQDS